MYPSTIVPESQRRTKRDSFRTVRRNKAWWALLFGVSAWCVACGDNCDTAADLMHQCCAKGPAELRAECEAEAKRLEENGNATSCENVEAQLTECKK